MARGSSEVPTEMVPINAVAARIGHLPEVVWGRLDPADVRQDWGYTYCVTPSRARELVDEFAAAALDAERITAERQRAHEEKQEREVERARKEAAASRPPAGERILHGVRTFGPGESEPGWANDGS